jgi:hypothetical protein
MDDQEGNNEKRYHPIPFFKKNTPIEKDGMTWK